MTQDKPSTQLPLDVTQDGNHEGPRRVQSVKGTKGDTAREARIKAALKANIARRKAQARARDDEDTEND